MDRVVLGENCILEGGLGQDRPNNNQIIVGCSGTGKSLSVMVPTLLEMEQESIIATYAKPSQARQLAAEFRRKGYNVQICDLSEPEKGDVIFDPILHINSFDDVAATSNQIVTSVMKRVNDDYWNTKAKAVLNALIGAELMTQDEPNFAHVLELFNRLELSERESGGVKTPLDAMFNKLARCDANCLPVREYKAYCMLPFRTASCVRDTLAAALGEIFPESVRNTFCKAKRINFRRLAQEKTALFVITSPVRNHLYPFANMIFAAAVRELIEYGEERGGRLPRNVRLMFDDFACGAPIHDFPKQIAIFRSVGISAMMLLQSESQLEAIYAQEDSTSILNNCSTYVYFPGGMDLKTCRSVSARVDMPMDEILYAPMGNVIIMQSGKKPVITRRYNIMADRRYRRITGEVPSEISAACAYREDEKEEVT